MRRRKHMTFMKPFSHSGRQMVYLHMLQNTPPSRLEQPTPWSGIIMYTFAVALVTVLLCAYVFGRL